MNKDIDKLVEDTANLIPSPLHPSIGAGHKEAKIKIAKQILSHPALLILNPDQSMPETFYTKRLANEITLLDEALRGDEWKEWCKDKQKRDSFSNKVSAYSFAQFEMREANFVKGIPLAHALKELK